MLDPNAFANGYSSTFNQLSQGFEMARRRKQEDGQRNALSALFANPNDPNALGEYARHDPRGAMQFRGQMQQQQQAGVEAHRENILKGAQIIRQLQPKDEAGWQQARAMAAQIGIPVDQIPPNYDPSYIRGVVALADTFAPQKQDQGTSLERNYQFLSGIDQALGDKYVKRQAEGSPFIMVNGVPHMFTGGEGGSEVPPILTDEDILRMEGGAGQSGPQTFP